MVKKCGERGVCSKSGPSSLTMFEHSSFSLSLSLLLLLLLKGLIPFNLSMSSAIIILFFSSEIPSLPSEEIFFIDRCFHAICEEEGKKVKVVRGLKEEEEEMKEVVCCNFSL